MTAQDANTQCQTSITTSHTCTLPETQKLTNGLNTIYVSCYDYDNSNDININVRSSDETIKEKAIDDCIRLVKNMVPTLEEKSQIRDNFIDKGGHHNILLQVCAVCGINDFKMILHGELFNIDKEWYNSLEGKKQIGKIIQKSNNIQDSDILLNLIDYI
jgi:hypothetical protein